jgi:hypothetical protein
MKSGTARLWLPQHWQVPLRSRNGAHASFQGFFCVLLSTCRAHIWLPLDPCTRAALQGLVAMVLQPVVQPSFAVQDFLKLNLLAPVFRDV